MKFKDEPVLVSTGIASALGWLGTFLVEHGVITNTVASTDTQVILPFVAAGALVLLGVIVRQFVTPAVVSLEGELAGLISRFAPGMDPAVKAAFGKVNDELAKAGSYADDWTSTLVAAKATSK